MDSSQRLQKVLAHCGVGSRRECEEIIEQGRVEVNGKVVTKLGTKIDPDADEIKVDGERVKPEERVYYLVHKPRGYICTNSDERGRPRVVDLIRDHRRIYTVGRLDEESEGLILLTNDGELANIVCHPRYQLDKTYRLTVRGEVAPEQVERIERGVWLSEGKTGPASVRSVDKRGQRTLVTVTLWEGRNRELRRIFAKVGLRVTHLVRTAIGPLRLRGLEPGAYRRLRPQELDFVRERMAPGWRGKPVPKSAKGKRKPGPKRGRPQGARGDGRGPRDERRGARDDRRGPRNERRGPSRGGGTGGGRGPRRGRPGGRPQRG
jgi:23S rRNA pseudouridine2605 synthase